jgi:hypothetical protein
MRQNVDRRFLMVGLALLGACSSNEARDRAETPGSTVDVAPPSAPPEPLRSATTRASSAPRPPQCSLPEIESKRAHNKYLECEWVASERRSWGKKKPTEEVTARLVPGAAPEVVARAVGASGFQRKTGVDDVYTFRFANAEVAADSVRSLMCHDKVLSASMVLLWTESDKGEWYDWCTDVGK